MKLPPNTITASINHLQSVIESVNINFEEEKKLLEQQKNKIRQQQATNNNNIDQVTSKSSDGKRRKIHEQTNVYR